MHSVREALDRSWVLDIDASIGPLYGRQQGELSDRRPALVRGDSGYGNEGILLELESRNQPYLLRLRQTANVQRLVARQSERQDWSRPDARGCQVVEDYLQLHGWSKKRRVVEWGLSGFTTHDINRCQTTARACALVYNWWSGYCRTTNPTARMQAITSRPLLLAAVGRATHDSCRI